MIKTAPLAPDPQVTLAEMQSRALGGYTLDRLIAEGGMGAVFEATTPDGHRCAIKILKPEYNHNPEMASKFLSEFASLARLRGLPGVVQGIKPLIDDTGRLAIVMEYIEGQTLRQRLAQQPQNQLALLDVVLLGAAIARAMADVHDSGLVHCDLKPENIMLLPTEGKPRVKIIDLGISCWLKRTGLTAPDPQPWSTAAYQGPELRQTRAPSATADVYSLGQILYECLTGEPRLSDGQPPAIPAPINEVVGRMLSRCPEDRPSMAEVAQELEAIQRACSVGTIAPIAIEQPASVRAAHPALRRGRLRSLAMASAVLCLLGFLVMRARRPSPSLRLPMPSGMTLLPAGTFQMGSTEDDAERARQRCLHECNSHTDGCPQASMRCMPDTFVREQPRHAVRIDHPVYVDNDLVTNRQFIFFLNNLSPRVDVVEDRDTHEPRFVHDDKRQLIVDLHTQRSKLLYNPMTSKFWVSDEFLDHPVEQVTWIGAHAYCGFSGKVMLTESVFEYAHTVLSNPQSETGLDLQPGIGEWTQDRHRGTYPLPALTLSEQLAQPAIVDGDSYRVVRGCSRNDLPVYCRPTARGYQRASNAPAHVGFRCMLPTQSR